MTIKTDHGHQICLQLWTKASDRKRRLQDSHDYNKVTSVDCNKSCLAKFLIDVHFLSRLRQYQAVSLFCEILAQPNMNWCWAEQDCLQSHELFISTPIPPNFSSTTGLQDRRMKKILTTSKPDLYLFFLVWLGEMMGGTWNWKYDKVLTGQHSGRYI